MNSKIGAIRRGEPFLCKILELPWRCWTKFTLQISAGKLGCATNRGLKISREAWDLQLFNAKVTFVVSKMFVTNDFGETEVIISIYYSIISLLQTCSTVHWHLVVLVSISKPKKFKGWNTRFNQEYLEHLVLLKGITNQSLWLSGCSAPSIKIQVFVCYNWKRQVLTAANETSIVPLAMFFSSQRPLHFCGPRFSSEFLSRSPFQCLRYLSG